MSKSPFLVPEGQVESQEQGDDGRPSGLDEYVQASAQSGENVGNFPTFPTEQLEQNVKGVKKRREEEKKKTNSPREEKEARRQNIEQLQREIQQLTDKVKQLTVQCKSDQEKIKEKDEKIFQLMLENQDLKTENEYCRKNMVQSVEMKKPKEEDREKSLQLENLAKEKANVVNIVKLQAKTMEKLTEKLRKLSEELEEHKKKENSKIEAWSACMEFGYPLEQVQAASRTHWEANRETAEKLMIILMEMEKNCQESQPVDSGHLAIREQMLAYFLKKNAVYPTYASFQARSRSFSGWQCSSIQSPERLAEAGFFYQGYGDCTRCFYCGNGLKQWLVNDEPWFEHARQFPKCRFVKCSKGQDFIDDVQRQCQLLEHQEENQVNQTDSEEQGNYADNVNQAMAQNGNELEQASVTDESEFEFGDKVEENNDESTVN